MHIMLFLLCYAMLCVRARVYRACHARSAQRPLRHAATAPGLQPCLRGAALCREDVEVGEFLVLDLALVSWGA